MKNRYLFALFGAGDITKMFWSALTASAIFGGLAYFKADTSFLMMSVFFLLPTAALFYSGVSLFDKGLNAAVSSWVNSADSADERVRRHQLFEEQGLNGALEHMRKSGVNVAVPAINVGGTAMANEFVDIHGNPYGVDSPFDGTDVNGASLSSHDAYNSPVGMDSSSSGSSFDNKY